MKARVLIIDDDVSVRKSIGKVLEGTGYEVAAASDGEEATVQFVPERTDLVLLDLNLPVRSGWDVFERLTTQHPSIPVIIITGMPNQIHTALAAGVGALIEKPIEVPTLLKVMEELLSEPKEARLRRMCGLQQDTRHLRRSNSETAGKSHPTMIPSRERRRLRSVQSWNEE